MFNALQNIRFLHCKYINYIIPFSDLKYNQFLQSQSETTTTNGRKSWDKVCAFGGFADSPDKQSREYNFTYQASPTTPRTMSKSRPATGHFRVAFCVPKRVFVEKHPYGTVFHTTGSLWYKLNIFSCERFCTTAKTRFETEAQGTSEIAYLSRFSTFY